MVTYQQAFGLNDNPFGPYTPLPGISNFKVMSMLVTRPLQVHIEEKLLHLYCREIAEFAEHERDFTDLIERFGYNFEQPARGLESFILFLRGSKGMGKTTLQNVMLHWLKQTQPQGEPEWKDFYAWPSDTSQTPREQVSKIGDLRDYINRNSKANDYCYVVIDNVLQDTENEILSAVFNLFTAINEDRFLCMFLSSSDDKLINQSWDNFQLRIEDYRLTELTADDAVAFVKHRMDYFRLNQQAQLLDTYPLFPFQEDDIRSGVEQNNGERRVITTRLLNVILKGALDKRIREIEDAFDFEKASGDTAEGHLVSVIDAFDEKAQGV